MNLTKIPLKALGGDAQSVTELFHRLNSVLPVDQQIVAVAPDMLCVDALKKMKEHRFSQLPVVVGREVLGLFSYRSFADAVVTLGQSAPRTRSLTLWSYWSRTASIGRGLRESPTNLWSGSIS